MSRDHNHLSIYQVEKIEIKRDEENKWNKITIKTLSGAFWHIMIHDVNEEEE